MKTRNSALAILIGGILFLSQVSTFAQIERGQTPELPKAQVKIKKNKITVKVSKPTVSDAELARLKKQLPEYDDYSWNLIKNSKNPEDFRMYLKMFPNGRHVLEARNKILTLEREAAQQSKRRCVLEDYNIKLPPNTFFNEHCMQFTLVNGGTFTMGSGLGDSDELPARQVKVSDFYIGRSEVTQMQWRAVMGNNPSYFTTPEPTEKGKLLPLTEVLTRSLPVESVTWEDAQEFVAKLNELDDGYYYRLPTEAEWEYVARWSMMIDYIRTPDFLSTFAWFGNNSGNSIIDAGSIWQNDKENYTKRLLANGNKTHTANTKKANGAGLYDMIGNVWEWCEDYYQPNYTGAPKDGTEVTTANSKNLRVLRGCSWYSDARSCRITNRSFYPQDESGSTIGLRVIAESKLQFLLRLKPGK